MLRGRGEDNKTKFRVRMLGGRLSNKLCALRFVIFNCSVADSFDSWVVVVVSGTMLVSEKQKQIHTATIRNSHYYSSSHTANKHTHAQSRVCGWLVEARATKFLVQLVYLRSEQQYECNSAQSCPVP